MSGQDKEQQLKEAISAGEPVTDIPLELADRLFPHQPDKLLRAGLNQGSRLGGGAGDSKGDAGFTQFDFLGQIQDEQHAVAGNVRDTVKIKLDSDKAGNVSRKSFQYDAGFTLEPGQLSHEVSAARKHHRQNGNLRIPIHHPRSQRRYVRPETQFGNLEQHRASISKPRPEAAEKISRKEAYCQPPRSR